jgi:hypothetical protein
MSAPTYVPHACWELLYIDVLIVINFVLGRELMNTLAKWTVDDYHSMIAVGILQDRQVELLAGEIHDMTPEGPLHTFYGGSLADFFDKV